MITLIFGAGASFGSFAGHPNRPPLGNNLFSELVKLNGAHAALDATQKEIFLNCGFEAGMATIANDSRIINPLQKELACYLAEFQARPDNSYVRLFNRLKLISNNIAIATLNYDLLIEQALVYNRIPFDYNGTNGATPLLKIHGSSNFLPELGTISIQGATMVNCGSFVDGLRVNAASDANAVRSWCNDVRNDAISPSLAMYEKGKRVVINNSLIRGIQDSYKKALAQSSHVAIIGLNYAEHDKHVWDPIASNGANILIVDPNPDSIIEWARKSRINSINKIPSGFNDAILKIARWARASALQK